ncbi:MAG: hypothetical protein DRO99_03300 [Candidatus Aenigmatarchaeota archaeon]|nr:MAG: hypothetical protein DRO99_03300 [Candidatus Aenigmarchaeota archaeon]
MAINPLLMTSGIGMILIGIVSIAYWKRRTGVKWKVFLFGMLIWAVAITAKSVMDITVTVPLQEAMLAYGGITGILAGMGLYVGIRTGLLESGLSYIGVKKSSLKMGFDDAMAFGIGFGAIECIIIGAGSFANILIFILMPETLATFPLDVRQVIIEQLSMSTLFVVPAIAERVFTVLIHAFTSVLAIYALNSGKPGYLWYSVGFKALVDGMIPAMVFFMKPGTSILGAFVIEVPIMVLAIVSFYGIKYARRMKWK